MSDVMALTQLPTKALIGTNVRNVKQPDITAINLAPTATELGFNSLGRGVKQQFKRTFKRVGARTRDDGSVPPHFRFPLHAYRAEIFH
jgi:hypothetical protein